MSAASEETNCKQEVLTIHSLSIFTCWWEHEVEVRHAVFIKEGTWNLVWLQQLTLWPRTSHSECFLRPNTETPWTISLFLSFIDSLIYSSSYRCQCADNRCRTFTQNHQESCSGTSSFPESQTHRLLHNNLKKKNVTGDQSHLWCHHYSVKGGGPEI